MDLKVIELFAGVGGFRVGLNHIEKFNEETGKAIDNGQWEFVWANQWEPSTKAQPAYECYTKRFGEEDASNTDINLVKKDKLPDHSLLVGGFPCQDYSVARSLSKEMGIQGKKGVLWWDIVDVIFHKRPPFVLLENVDRLLKSPAKQRGRDFAVMLKTLGQLGYIVQWRMINSGEYAMPQRRRRIFIFASKKDAKYSDYISKIEDKKEYLFRDGFFNDIFPIKKPEAIEEKDLSIYKDEVEVSDNYNQGKFLTSGLYIDDKVIEFDIEEITEKFYTITDVMEEAAQTTGINLESYTIKDKELEKWEYLKGGKRIPRKRPDGSEYFYTEGSMAFPENPDLPSRTMLTSEGTTNRSSHAVYDKNIDAIRKLTEIEAELLQMFPADWTNIGMTSRQRYFMMGNALVTGIISRLEYKLRNIIIKE